MVLESLDIMISLGVIYLVLSMVQKYAMSLLKRILRTKADVVTREMKVFMGEYTSRYLKLYLKKKAKHLNMLQKTDFTRQKNGFRLLSKEEIKEVSLELKRFLESRSESAIQKDLKIKDPMMIQKLSEVKEHLGALQTKVETVFDNTLRKIDGNYKKKIRVWSFVSAFLLAFAMNASFFDIYEKISTNPVFRERLVTSVESIKDKLSEIDEDIERLGEIDDKTALKDLARAKDKIVKITNSLPDKSKLFGWEEGELIQVENKKIQIHISFNKLFGFCISAFLMSFGAPFWHDYLKTFVNIKKTLVRRKEQENPASQVPSGEQASDITKKAHTENTKPESLQPSAPVAGNWLP